MNLKMYLYSKNISMKEFSEKLDCNTPYLSRIATGAIRPGKRLAKDIERLTDGQVLFSDLQPNFYKNIPGQTQNNTQENVHL